MHRALLTLLIIFQCGATNATEYTHKQCSAAVAAIETTKNKVTPNAVSTFLDSLISTTCKRSAEYSEWSNEALFNVMQKNPSVLFFVLRTSSKSIQAQVHEELSHPIHEMNYPKIYKSISRISDDDLREYALQLFTPFYKEHLTAVKKWEKLNNQKWTYPK